MRFKEIRNDIYDFLKIKDNVLIFPLSILIFRFFFSERRNSIFDILALAAIALWRFYFNEKPRRSLPDYLIVCVLLYMLSDIVGALLSENIYWQLDELRKYIHVFIAGLLFTLPIEKKTRQFAIILFFTAAAVSGFQGIWQYLKMGVRSYGFLPNPPTFATALSLACGPALILFIKKIKMSESKILKFFLFLVIVTSIAGILFSETRGIWIGFLGSGFFTLFVYDRRKALLFLLGSLIVLSITVYFSTQLRARTTSIITSVYTEDEKGSTGSRIELWKGALLIFRKSPIYGVGTGNFEPNIKKLVLEKKIRKTPIIIHAHNLFLQVLATKGIMGFAILAGLLSALFKWGIDEINNYPGAGGYIIIFVTFLTIINGLTDDTLETVNYLNACCFTIGLLGPYRLDKEKPQLQL